MIDAKFNSLVQWLRDNGQLHADDKHEHLFNNELLKDAYLSGLLHVSFYKGKAVYRLSARHMIGDKVMSNNNLTMEEDVVAYMSAAKSQEDWNNRGDAVKKANNGYPEFWFPAIILSGVAAQTEKRWNRGEK